MCVEVGERLVTGGCNLEVGVEGSQGFSVAPDLSKCLSGGEIFSFVGITISAPENFLDAICFWSPPDLEFGRSDSDHAVTVFWPYV